MLTGSFFLRDAQLQFGFMILLSLLFAAQAAWSQSDCTEYKRVAFELDLQQRKLILISESKTQRKICSEMPVAGNENVTLSAIGGDGKELFRRELFLNDVTHYDFPNNSKTQGQLKGGVASESKPVLSTLIPVAALNPKTRFIIRRKKSQEVLVEATLEQ